LLALVCHQHSTGHLDNLEEREADPDTGRIKTRFSLKGPINSQKGPSCMDIAQHLAVPPLLTLDCTTAPSTTWRHRPGGGRLLAQKTHSYTWCTRDPPRPWRDLTSCLGFRPRPSQQYTFNYFIDSITYSASYGPIAHTAPYQSICLGREHRLLHLAANQSDIAGEKKVKVNPCGCPCLMLGLAGHIDGTKRRGSQSGRGYTPWRRSKSTRWALSRVH
jgi:hypothetical protein